MDLNGDLTMKLTAKTIAIDLRRRRALDRAHAQEVEAASAAYRYPEAEDESESLDWSANEGSRQRVVIMQLHFSTQKLGGAT